MNVQEFMMLEKPEMFDISGEYSSDVYVNASPCEKYIIYKAYIYSDKNWSEAFKSGKEFCLEINNYFTENSCNIIDPDNGSELLQDVYRFLWPFMIDESKNKFWSDTLSTVQYTMADVFEMYIESDEAKAKRQALGVRQKCSIRYILDYFSNIEGDKDIRNKISMAAKKIKNIHNMEGFLSAWHTIGNYCPVPKGFNSPRSNFGKHDMWDLSLMKIRQWYLTSNTILKEKILAEDLFHFNKKGDVISSTKWLEQFGDGQEGWVNFVNTFYFQDWVNKDYEVLPLCANHDWTYAFTPINNLDEFLINYKERIYKRGLRIMEKLREVSIKKGYEKKQYE